MTIKRIMMGLLATLSILLLIAQTQLFSRAHDNSIRSSQAEMANIVVSNLLKAAGSWALERGVTNGALNAPDAAPPEILQKISAIRQVDDKAFRDAMENVGAASLLVEGTYKQDIDTALAKVNDLRQAVDKNLSLPKAARDTNVMSGWVPAITALIMETQRLRINLSSQALVGEAALGKDTLMRQSFWMMTEFAGRERAVIAGIIASGAPISPDQLQELAGFRSRVEGGWNIASNIHLSNEEHAAFDASVAAAKQDFFGDFETVRQKIYSEAKTGGASYSMKAQDWIARSTQAIDTLLKLQEVSTKWTAALMESNKAQAQQQMLLYGMLLLTAVLAVIGALWVILRRVTGPINTLASSMGSIAAGELQQQVPYLQRTDEIGTMAQSVEVFRKNGMEKIALEEQAKQAEVAAAAEKKRTMQKLAADFESSVQGIINTVAAAATELYQTAESMNTTVANVSHKSGTVATASQQTSSNVENVASAVEEMSASIKEIASQITKSSTLINDTVSKTQQADKTVHLLSDAVTQIGSVLELIQNIASQINLLALNATIESARAGEAGKGFAVVASEVKNLANQTSKATENVAAQMTNAKKVSEDVARVLDAIHQSVNNVSQVSGAIAAAVEEQSAATSSISSNMLQASQGVQHITSSVADITKGAADADHAAQEVLKAAKMLSEQSELLNGQVKNFLDGIRA